MRTVETYFADYGAYHQTRGNKLTHVLGIPMIVLSSLGLLNQIRFFEWGIPGVNASPALVAWLIVNLFYLRLHLLLGLSMVVTTGVMLVFGAMLPVGVLWGLFAFGWVVQFVGHIAYEKKSPAFAKNLVHLMIGPIFIQNYVLRLVK